VETAPLQAEGVIDVAADEPWAANVLTFGQHALLPDCFPNSAAMLAARGWRVHTVDISELRKAEAGVTCSSLVFSTPDLPGRS
jgi:dimethylargininase